MPERPGVPRTNKITKKNLSFNSDFESGNLDTAIRISDTEYDLFMRVDSNTKGHTNWYYFEVENGDWIGSVQFNFCNFRREKSLYQRVNLQWFREWNLMSNPWKAKRTGSKEDAVSVTKKSPWDISSSTMKMRITLTRKSYDNQGKIVHLFYYVVRLWLWYCQRQSSFCILYPLHIFRSSQDDSWSFSFFLP